MRLKPIDATASRIHSDSGGVKASHEREWDDLGLEDIAGTAQGIAIFLSNIASRPLLHRQLLVRSISILQISIIAEPWRN